MGRSSLWGFYFILNINNVLKIEFSWVTGEFLDEFVGNLNLANSHCKPFVMQTI